MSQRGAGGRIRSTTTTRAWLTKSSTSDPTIGNRWHFGTDFEGVDAGTSSDVAMLSGAGADIASSLPLETLAGGLGLGYGLYCIVMIEGWNHLYPEALADGAAFDEYLWEDAALVIDRSARLGPVVDGDSHIAKAMDFELRLLDCASVRELFGRPTVYTTLIEEFVPGDAIAYVKSTRGFDGVFHIGTTRFLTSGSQHNAFLSVDDDEFGTPKRYPAGTLVTNSPYTLEGRRVRVYVAAIDPSGRYVQTDNVLDQAAVLFEGYIAERPVRDGTEWVVTVRDEVRKLADPLGLAASGKAVWTADDDVLVDTPLAQVFVLKMVLGGTTPVDAVVQPFAGLSSRVRMSDLRKAVIDALTDASALIGGAEGEIIGYAWRPRPMEESGRTVWDLVVRFNPDTGQTFAAVNYAEVQPRDLAGFSGIGGGNLNCTFPDTTDEIEMLVGIFHVTTNQRAALAVDLDEGEPALLPPAGRVVVEGDGAVSYYEYTSVQTDDLNPTRVTLQLVGGPTGQDAVGLVMAEGSSPSVRFLWSDSGKLADILRRMLVSTGEGRNGVWDTLPRGHGLGLPNIDAGSFDRVFGGGAIGGLHFQIAADAGTSLGELFDGLFRLSRRAVVSRRRADGRSVEIAAVDLGPCDSGVPVATIADVHLALQQGRRPVRVKSTYTVPQAMRLKCRTIPAGDVPAGEGVITLRDPHLSEWTKTRWDLDIYGLTRDQVLEPAIAWATSWFRAGETRQLLELDVHPRIGMAVQIGDVVALELVDASLWDYAQGSAGYTGLARVLGAVVAPAPMLPTLLVACDGVLTSGAMSPSIPILAVNGVATTPTSIDVPILADDGASYYELLVHALGDAESMYLVAYEPGSDSGRARYTITFVVDVGSGLCRLTVSAYPSAPSVTLTTSFRLTWAIASEATEEQGVYLHNTDVTQWG